MSFSGLNKNDSDRSVEEEGRSSLVEEGGSVSENHDRASLVAEW